jgi:phosphoribosylamine--glycine ligase
MKNKKNILIVGTGATAQALVKKLSQDDSVGEIFVAPSCFCSSLKCTPIDIREDDLTGLLKFALEKNIFLTIPISKKSLNADIVSFFFSNGQNIFGPTKDACNMALNKSTGKKFLYKIHAQTSKFGIFDKESMAQDYLKSAQYPIIIRSNESDESVVSTTFSLSDEILNTLFAKKNETNVLIEEFTYGHEFTRYYITDGYSALPLTNVANYKFREDGDSGLLSNGIGCFAPDYKVSETICSRVDNIIQNTLISLDKKEAPYVGIIGLNCTITGKDKFYVNEFQSFLQDYDASAVLNLIEDNLIEIFTACVNGLFADEYEQIKTNDYSSVSAVVFSRQSNKEIVGIEDFNDIDFQSVIKTSDGRLLTKTIGESFVVTKTSSTITRARQKLYEDLAEINFEGMKYRKDIASTHKFEF